jgi:hypothetical protein
MNMIKISEGHPALVLRPRGLLVLVLLTALPASGCYREPTRWDQVQQETRRNQPAVAREGVAGGEFNKMFPKPEGDFDVVYTQEKKGFAQAVLKKAGNEVATLSVFDTVSNPEAAENYKSATMDLKGYPMIDIGEQGTGVLVGNRFQVQVRTKDANFDKAQRQDWLARFDLANLEQLAKLQ